ncbi:hypothetical protein RJ639_015291 [Escallonia herrerae]|uniref:Wall-associated receptor kinase galacturonan-binding domain-containing protein n=1 Tax=Escallonia herrerae TaxID=1293975 RepID=A0AA89AMB7_9ASTE|nr:hypothetical protein RJ639_015291 [Escallonia herrerae]
MILQLVHRVALALLLIQATAHALSLAKPGCQERCGNVVIPYPFGVGADCSSHETFAIACNSSFTPAKPFHGAINMEVLEISLQGTIRVNNPISTSNCPNRPDSTLKMDTSKTPFSFSDSQSKFTAMGCNNLELINGKDVETGGCTSFCNSSWRPSTCYGINCCQTRIPPSLKVTDVSLTNVYSNNGVESCKRAFMVEKDWFANLTNPFDVHFMENVPVVLDWTANATCKNFTERYIKDQYETVCACGWGSEGNPYLVNGCQEFLSVERVSFCNITSRDNTCYGINCCQTRIPPFLKFINASLGSIDRSNDQTGCKYAFMVDQDWFTNLTGPYVVQRMDNVPVVLNWRPYGACRSFGAFNSATDSSESLCRTQTFCTNQSLCSCNPGYDGNPYLPDGCQGKDYYVDECAKAAYMPMHVREQAA